MALRHRLSLLCMMRFSADGSLFAEGVGQIALAADVVDLIAGGGILRLRRGHGHSHVAGLELHRGAIVVRDGKEVYHGIEDIPAEHRIFAYPKLNIREQMAAYKEVIDRSSLEGERLHPRKEHDDR